MENLFEQYKNITEKLPEALLAGRNLVNKNPGNFEIVSSYLDFLLHYADILPNLKNRKEYLGQASIILTFFEENAELTAELIEKIIEYRNRIDIIAKNIDETEEIENNNALALIVDKNNDLIKQLMLIKQKVSDSKTSDEFEDQLEKLKEVDYQINHDYMSQEQNSVYDDLNKECSEIISSKMREIEHLKNIEYNKEAVEAFEKAFRLFKDNESKYKQQSQLFSLVSSTLFAFDAGKLFNETLIYYSHVYSYIFGKLDDDGKLALTRYSIECERRLK